MIDSAKILKLCNDIEDIVTDMDVHCTQAGWTECMEILSKIKQIGEELAEQPKTNGDRIRAMTDEELAHHYVDAICHMHKECPSINCIECGLNWLKKDVSETG